MKPSHPSSTRRRDGAGRLVRPGLGGVAESPWSPSPPDLSPDDPPRHRRRLQARSHRVPMTTPPHAHSPPRGRPPSPDRGTDRTLLQDLKHLDRSGHPWRPHVALLWTCKSTRNLADALTGMGHRPEPSDRRPTAGRSGLQPPGQPQDRGGEGPPGPRCPVRAHQPQGPLVPAAGPAGGLGRHQEEGNRRELQESRPGVAAAAAAAPGQVEGLPGQGPGQGTPTGSTT